MKPGFPNQVADSGSAFRVGKWETLIERVEKESLREASTTNEGIEEETEDVRGKFSPAKDKEKTFNTSLHMPCIYLRKVTGTVREQLEWSRKFSASFPAWEPEESIVRKELQKRPAEEMASRFYCGVSGEKDGWERDQDDLKSGSKTRYPGFITTNHLENRVKHLHIKISGDKWRVG